MDSSQPGEGGGGARPNRPSSPPEIIRPIPRRPFLKPNFSFSSPTPPEDDEDGPAAQSRSRSQSRRPTPNISASDLRFLLDPAHNQHSPSSSSSPLNLATSSGRGTTTGGEDTPLSRAASFLTLTSSTLFGIYSPSSVLSFTTGATGLREEEETAETAEEDRHGDAGLMSGGFDSDFDLDDDGGVHTPRRTPAPRPGLDETTYALMKVRSRSARAPRIDAGAGPPTAQVALALVLRGLLLFVLGVGYGVLVTRFPSRPGGQQQVQQQAEGGYEWRYLAFWGVAGVVLGGLLPWFDKIWERRVAAAAAGADRGNNRGIKGTDSDRDGNSDEAEAEIDADAIPTTPPPPPSPSPPAETDWALVMRGIGAFVGIVFAIRKLPWASTMQVSLTLALTNPFLWYLIDRSKPGFLLSAAVGLAGSLASLVMGVAYTDMMMPAPGGGGGAASTATSGLSNRVGFPGGVGGSLFPGGDGTASAVNSSGLLGTGTGTGTSTATAATTATVMGGLASQETVEAGIWMLSVLFCSCVCFGNIGRRLALNSSAAGRGRWGGVR